MILEFKQLFINTDHIIKAVKIPNGDLSLELTSESRDVRLQGDEAKQAIDALRGLGVLDNNTNPQDVLTGKVRAALLEFISNFELIFDNDWEFTKASINDGRYIVGTFLRPSVDDESNNWANRGGLLASYRRLIFILNNDKDFLQLMGENDPAFSEALRYAMCFDKKGLSEKDVDSVRSSLEAKDCVIDHSKKEDR